MPADKPAATVHGTGSGEATCPTCGDVATYQTPDGTLWDGNAHYWRVPPTVIRCDSCGGTLVYKRTDEGFLVYHACCGKYGRTPAPSPVTNVEETRVTSTDERARVESQPCGKWNKLHVMTLLTDVAQLLDGWHQDGTAWSEWDEEVRQRVSSYLRQVHTTPSEQFDTSVTALREENARLQDIAGNQTDRIDALIDESCKLQDDIASIVSTHRADWSWEDVVEDVRRLAALSSSPAQEQKRGS